MSREHKKRKAAKHERGNVVRIDSNRDTNGQFKRGNKLGHRFRPGESGNPGGRPKIKLISQAAREILAQPVPHDRLGRTYAELIAVALATRASRGNVAAASELADRSEGRPRVAVEIDQHDPLADLLAQIKKEYAKCPPVENRDPSGN